MRLICFKLNHEYNGTVNTVQGKKKRKEDVTQPVLVQNVVLGLLLLWSMMSCSVLQI